MWPLAYIRRLSLVSKRGGSVGDEFAAAVPFACVHDEGVQNAGCGAEGSLLIDSVWFENLDGESVSSRAGVACGSREAKVIDGLLDGS